ncbi:hypothetical protein ANCCAN_05576, partial [Ancylostoma caninum]
LVLVFFNASLSSLVICTGVITVLLRIILQKVGGRDEKVFFPRVSGCLLGQLVYTQCFLGKTIEEPSGPHYLRDSERQPFNRRINGFKKLLSWRHPHYQPVTDLHFWRNHKMVTMRRRVYECSSMKEFLLHFLS